MSLSFGGWRLKVWNWNKSALESSERSTCCWFTCQIATWTRVTLGFKSLNCFKTFAQSGESRHPHIKSHQQGRTNSALITFIYLNGRGRQTLFIWAASLLSPKEGISEKPGIRSFLALQKHPEASLIIVLYRPLCGSSSTQKTRKNSFYNIHIYKYI